MRNIKNHLIVVIIYMKCLKAEKSGRMTSAATCGTIKTLPETKWGETIGG